MSARPPSHSRSSRQRYREFVRDYRRGRLDEVTEAAAPGAADAQGGAGRESIVSSWRGLARGRRREYLRDYMRWLRPHRVALAVVFGLSLLGAGLQMSSTTRSSASAA